MIPGHRLKTIRLPYILCECGWKHQVKVRKMTNAEITDLLLDMFALHEQDIKSRNGGKQK